VDVTLLQGRSGRYSEAALDPLDAAAGVELDELSFDELSFDELSFDDDDDELLEEELSDDEEVLRLSVR
jgi:hypothetical protein